MMSKKRVYIGLLGASLAVVAGIFALIWYLVGHQEYAFTREITRILGMGLVTILALSGIGILALIISIVNSQRIPSLEGSIRIATTLLSPIAVQVGSIFGISKEKVLGSYIEVNNCLVRALKGKVKPENTIILAPHCLQDSECTYKVTDDVYNCRRCGKCDISHLIDVAEQYGAQLRIATGGTLARRVIKDVQPQAVVAIACERDLSMGIQDSNPLPVMGVLNQRPNGPCRDTMVDMRLVEEALNFITGRYNSIQKEAW